MECASKNLEDPLAKVTPWLVISLHSLALERFRSQEIGI
jgi:hypothetical protein